MSILLTAATTFEIEPTLQLLEKKGYSLHETQVTVLITGIGSVSATYLLTNAVVNNKPRLVIQAGIAGSFDVNKSPAGSVVLVKYDSFGDLGTEEKDVFTTIFDAGFEGKNHFPYSDGWLINPHPYLANPSLPVVKSITINKVSDSSLQRRQLTESFSPEIESMEGAALHYVCLQQNIPFLQLRSISNEVGERDKSKWRTKEAVHNLNVELLKLMEREW